MSNTLDIQHFVFGTHCRRQTIPLNQREPLYRFIWKLLKERHCHLYRINGMRDHLHIVVNLHSSISKARLIQDIKSLSNHWMRRSRLYPDFEGWCTGFFSESKDPSTLDRTIAYVRGQVEHHSHVSFEEEILNLYRDAGLTWDEKTLM